MTARDGDVDRVGADVAGGAEDEESEGHAEKTGVAT
jgi:hypothetical protein